MTKVIPRDRRLLTAILSPSRSCASPAQLERMGEPGTAMSDHVASCPRCQAERALLREFEAATPLAHEQAAVAWISHRLEQLFSSAEPLGVQQARLRRGFTTPWWRRWLAFPSFNSAGLAFSAVLVAVALGVGLREAQKPRLAEPRNAGATALRSGGLTALSPVGELQEAPTALRWEPMPGANSYSVRMTEVDNVEVWTTQTSATSVVLPPQVLTRVVPGKPLLWQVTAKDLAGGTVAQSAIQRFRLRLAKR
jgi:hypothetical protein